LYPATPLLICRKFTVFLLSGFRCLHMSNLYRLSASSRFNLGTARSRKVLWRIAFYSLPLAISIAAAVALLFWRVQDAESHPKALQIRVFSSVLAPSEPAAALRELKTARLVDEYETDLSVLPVWFSFKPSFRDPSSNIIEFPSRHALNISCWDGESLAPLGGATRAAEHGDIERSKAGYMLSRSIPLPASIVCRSGFAGPARLSVRQWVEGEYEASVRRFHRESGLFDGGMVVLAIFIAVAALINREKLYLVLAGWLILNLRVGALSAGWDIQWLGQEVPIDWLLRCRAVAMMLYGISMLTLYQALLGNQLAELRYVLPLRVLQWLCLPLLVAALILPFGVFLPPLWILLLYGFTMMTIGLLKVMVLTPNRSAAWFAGSFAITFLGALGEVVSAALGIHEMLGFLNSVTAALASSVLASLAVAEQMRIETEKRIDAQQKLERAYAVMPVGLLTLDMSGAFLSANPAALRLLGVDSVTVGATRWTSFFAERLWTHLREELFTKHEAEVHMERIGRDRVLMMRATSAGDRVEAVLQDVTEKTEATERLRFLAENDPLTHVYNRRGIERAFDAVSFSASATVPLSLAYVDLDRFRLVNDRFGHRAGDEVLRQVCVRMQNMLGFGQPLGRVGGDEFLIVMADTSLERASKVCRDIVSFIAREPYSVGDKSFHVSGSIGLLEVEHGMSMKEAVSIADRACRRAKEGMSAGVVAWDRNSRALAELQLERELIERLSGPRGTEPLQILMQPIVSLDTPDQPLSFEVLLRVQDPDGSIVSGAALLAAAEKNGRTDLIDHWVLSTTLAWVEENIDALDRASFICVNLAGASLSNERFVRDSLELLERHATATPRLCVEVSEQAVLGNFESARKFFAKVQCLGVKVALDNFGAGPTSFQYLQELPIDALKIDGSLLENIGSNAHRRAVVESIVQLAGNLGVRTVAECVDDQPTIRVLSDIGVHYVQGYAVAYPQSPASLLAMAPLSSSTTTPVRSPEVG
jgi:diguanylate cyclase (GGDEF)-like protein